MNTLILLKPVHNIIVTTSVSVIFWSGGVTFWSVTPKTRSRLNQSKTYEKQWKTLILSISAHLWYASVCEGAPDEVSRDLGGKIVFSCHKQCPSANIFQGEPLGRIFDSLRVRDVMHANPENPALRTGRFTFPDECFLLLWRRLYLRLLKKYQTQCCNSTTSPIWSQETSFLQPPF